MEVQNNAIISCLGKTLKTEIKFIAIISFKYINSNTNKETFPYGKDKNVTTNKRVLTLGKNNIFILDQNMDKIIEEFTYDSLACVELDRKNPESCALYLRNGALRAEINKVMVISKYREALIKSLMCYYSIYNMQKNFFVKDLRVVFGAEADVSKPKAILKGIARKYRKIANKGYEFFIKYYIQDNYNNTVFKISYLELDEVENVYASSAGNLTVEISEPIQMLKFDTQKDDRDLSFFAYNSFLIYIRNTLKMNKWWITKNKIYQKKYNLNEDIAQWEGWTIEARTCDPIYKNLIFIYLRRKFIPPYFDTFQNITLIYKENCRSDNYKLNPAANEVIELAANTIHFTTGINNKEYALFLRAKIDGLLVDEESLYFFQTNLQLIGKDVHKFGFEFLYTALQFVEKNGRDKDKLQPIRNYVESKIKAYNDNDAVALDVNVSHITGKNPNFSALVDEFYNMIGLAQAEEEKNQDPSLEMVKDDNDPTPGETDGKDTPTPKDDTTKDTPENDEEENEETPNVNTNQMKSDLVKQQEERAKRQNRILTWRTKVNRFLTYCLNGGLTDYLMTYEQFILFFFKCQHLSNELNDFIMSSMNLIDLENIVFDENDKLRISIQSLNENSKISFNEDAVAVCIKSGFLSKQLSESFTYCPTFIKLLLTNYCTNKMLKLLRHLNEQAAEDAVSEERKAFTIIINVLCNIFKDFRKCPITLINACKCLISLVQNEGDKKNRTILIQENIISCIIFYLDYYDYDEKLVLCCLELFSYLLSQIKLQIGTYLYGDQYKLVNVLKQFLVESKVPGTFYSQRIIVKVLTIFLNLTNILESEIRDRFNTPDYITMYNVLLRIIDEEHKKTLIDYSEESSFILEFKTFWLLCILTYKNPTAKEYIFDNYKIIEFIEAKAERYIELANYIMLGKLKSGLTDSKVVTITKNITKFAEFVYYLLLKDPPRIIEFKSRRNSKFNTLITHMDNNRKDLSIGNEFDVYNWLQRIYKDSEKDLYD